MSDQFNELYTTQAEVPEVALTNRINDLEIDSMANEFVYLDAVLKTYKPLKDGNFALDEFKYTDDSKETIARQKEVLSELRELKANRFTDSLKNADSIFAEMMERLDT